MLEHVDLANVFKTIKFIATYRFKVLSVEERLRVQDRILELTKVHGIPNVNKEYVRALGNGVHHGAFPIRVKLCIGEQGQMLCLVKDSGKGFDYQTVIEKYKAQQVYYHHKGIGFQSYGKNRHLAVDWTHHGKECILFYNGDSKKRFVYGKNVI
jgi:hypothetical protein